MMLWRPFRGVGPWGAETILPLICFFSSLPAFAIFSKENPKKVRIHHLEIARRPLPGRAKKEKKTSPSVPLKVKESKSQRVNKSPLMWVTRWDNFSFCCEYCFSHFLVEDFSHCVVEDFESFIELFDGWRIH